MGGTANELRNHRDRIFMAELRHEIGLSIPLEPGNPISGDHAHLWAERLYS